jgi:hypothetical protein
MATFACSVNRQADADHEARARAAEPQHSGSDLIGPPELQQIATITGTFKDALAWLGSAANGIDHLFANEAVLKRLCVAKSDGSQFCVTGDELAAMAAGTPSSGVASGGAGGSPARATSGPPIITVNGANPALIQINETYADLGATITGPTADLNLGIHTFVDGIATDPVVIDTSTPAPHTIDYVVTDTAGLTSTSTRTLIVSSGRSGSARRLAGRCRCPGR